jgi:hypothetical protein
VIPFSDQQTGLRDWRVPVARKRTRWPWLVGVAVLIALLFGVRR